MPCLDLFLEQSDDYQSKVIKPELPALVVELSHPNSWYKILNKGDIVLGIESFGESAPANVLLEHFGFTTENVVELSKSLVND
jgi:transketolase